MFIDLSLDFIEVLKMDRHQITTMVFFVVDVVFNDLVYTGPSSTCLRTDAVRFFFADTFSPLLDSFGGVPTEDTRNTGIRDWIWSFAIDNVMSLTIDGPSCEIG